ncbi:MAG: glycosyltransferase [Myxococcales bacterium]|nr:glycosyltransferase [Myxococcales bacterium]
MNTQKDHQALVVVTNAEADLHADGSIGMTAKFVDGMARYAELWDGPIRCVCPPREAPNTDLDPTTVRSGECGFEVQVSHLDAASLRPALSDAAVVMASAGYLQNHISTLGTEMDVPVVYVCELSIRTRLDIARSEERRPVRLARRAAWELNQERKQRQAIRRGRGVQCNGTPTYDAYRSLTDNALLYFDTRSDDTIIASDAAVERRLAQHRNGRLRLGFSGRLVSIKGVDDLVAVAVALAERGVDFEFQIFGDGDRRQSMQAVIDEANLSDRVQLCGAVDFASELMPRIRDEVDLFVCCHLQGDPSCTYLETMACGVPIVGYANEAFAGLLERVNAGQAVKVGDVQALADLIERIAQRREQLYPWSRTAVAFAREHSFERTFERRIAHMASVAGLN